jgi:hypothetical protein
MAMQGAAKDRELPLSQHAVMTSMKRSGNPACRADPMQGALSIEAQEYLCSLGSILGED